MSHVILTELFIASQTDDSGGSGGWGGGGERLGGGGVRGFVRLCM